MTYESCGTLVSRNMCVRETRRHQTKRYFFLILTRNLSQFFGNRIYERLFLQTMTTMCFSQDILSHIKWVDDGISPFEFLFLTVNRYFNRYFGWGRYFFIIFSYFFLDAYVDVPSTNHPNLQTFSAALSRNLRMLGFALCFMTSQHSGSGWRLRGGR